MKKGMLLFLVPALLILASLTLNLKAVEAWRDYAKISAELAAKRQGAVQAVKPSRVMTEDEMATAVDIVDALARKKGLEAKTRVDRAGVTVNVPPEGLADFDRVISFLGAIDNLPYPEMTYEDFCAGTECGDGIHFLLRLNPALAVSGAAPAAELPQPAGGRRAGGVK